MNVLVACEFSGVVREAFRARGHEAWSCDLLPTDSLDAEHNRRHIQADINMVLNYPMRAYGPWTSIQWDLMIAFPPCTHLAVSGAHRFAVKQREQSEALEFVRMLMNADVPRIALENPVGVISTKIRKPDQIIQPYDFGEDASKRTCLWLKGLPTLHPTNRILGRIVTLPTGRQVERWSNQTDSGQNRLPPSADRWKKRSATYRGIAEAMADQWGGLA